MATAHVGTPLRRLTPLGNDPAATWLTPRERLRVAAAGWMIWSVLFASVVLLWLAARALQQPAPVIEPSLQPALSGTFRGRAGWMPQVPLLQLEAWVWRAAALVILCTALAFLNPLRHEVP